MTDANGWTWKHLLTAFATALAAALGVQATPAATSEDVRAIVQTAVEPLRAEVVALREKLALQSGRLDTIERTVIPLGRLSSARLPEEP